MVMMIVWAFDLVGSKIYDWGYIIKKNNRLSRTKVSEQIQAR
jgi:hypothetical protein